MTDSVLTPGRRWVAAGCLFLAPIAFAASELAFPGSDGSTADMLDALGASPAAAMLGIAMMGLSAVLFLPALGGLLALVTGRGAGLVTWGVGLMGFGLVGTAGLYGANVMLFSMSQPQFDHVAMARVVDSGAPALALPMLGSHWVMVVGALVLGIGVWRAAVGPRWAAICIGLCGVADTLLSALPVPELVGAVISEGAMIAGFGAYGWYVLRVARRAASNHVAVPVTA